MMLRMESGDELVIQSNRQGWRGASDEMKVRVALTVNVENV